ncbi:MAG TPA: NrfD/PsrC family molybdoenzyme membrane anchor subunit [Terracidiphilus sp.]|nr:NrfD/PsrC family molybdoenzyme membrane anchor subunit [Terracidiphilus sp.]
MIALTELTVLRHNPLVDPTLHVWQWQIPIYLFLGGLVAGLMIIAGVRLIAIRPKQREALVCCTIGPLVGLAFLSLGMLVLFLDLSHKLFVWRLYTTFQVTSPMSWGSWILLLVYPALLGNALAHLPEAIPALANRFPVLVTWSDFILERERLVLAIGIANVLVGIALGIYTGILLGTLGARPLWNSALLGPLFLFSGLSNAAAVLHGILVVTTPDEERPAFADFLLSSLARLVKARPLDKKVAPVLAGADNSFLTIELCLLCLFLIGQSSSTGAHQQAAGLLLTGSYAAAFFVFVIGLGILLPLVLQTLELNKRIQRTLAPAMLVVFGGLALRFILVFAGQESHWFQALN